jgi:hypothetical protein
MRGVATIDNVTVVIALEHEQRIGTDYLQLQLCLKNPTVSDAHSIVWDAKQDILWQYQKTDRIILVSWSQIWYHSYQ